MDKKYSFYDFCKEYKFEFLLELWDYDKNQFTPKQVTPGSNERIYFKCPRGLHESESVILNTVTRAFRDKGEYKLCKACNSIGQFIIDVYGFDYLNSIWSGKNEIDSFDISSGGATKFWIKCLLDATHPDYDVRPYNFKVSHKCPYCEGKKICETNNFAYIYPQFVYLWSELNTISPYEVAPRSNKKVYWKCHNSIHEDYKRSLDESTRLNFECPTCNYEGRYHPSGAEHPNWKGGVKTENEKVRSSRRYSKWRSSVFERDGYTCQCCGIYGGELEAHHIHDFANNIEERMDVDNGITLCKKCHSLSYDDSLHSLYGTIKVGENELEEYINNKRKELGIDIPFSIDKYRNGEILTKNMINNNYEGAWDLSAGRKFVKSLNKPNNKNFIMMKPKYRIKEEC